MISSATASLSDAPSPASLASLQDQIQSLLTERTASVFRFDADKADVEAALSRAETPLHLVDNLTRLEITISRIDAKLLATFDKAHAALTASDGKSSDPIEVTRFLGALSSEESANV